MKDPLDFYYLEDSFIPLWVLNWIYDQHSGFEPANDNEIAFLKLFGDCDIWIATTLAICACATSQTE